MKVNVVIEIPKGSGLKYEHDKKTNTLHLDRVLRGGMTYPGNYGYIENTLAQDGDALDVLIISDHKLEPLTHVLVKPIGVLIMKDECGIDEKVIAVLHDSVDPRSKRITELSDISDSALADIDYFFRNYKKLDTDRWSEVVGYRDSVKTAEIILKYTEAYTTQFNPGDGFS